MTSLVSLDNQKKVVYYDENYDSAFVGHDEGKTISDFMVGKGFTRLGAIQLRDWMAYVTTREVAPHTSVVFAMDMVPQEIFGDVDGNILFRRYLDAGGRVTWLADVPTWYKGKPGKEREDVWQLGSFVSLLGIAPVLANCVKPVELTSRGRELGLRLAWYSMRPILVNKDWFCEYSAKSAISGMPVEVLAWTNVTLGTSVVRIPSRWHRLRSFSAGIQALGVGGQVTVVGSESTRIYNKRCASAWHIAFNPHHPNQGFFRIWDHVVRLLDLNEERLLEVYNIATRNLSI
jgi:DUF971 family protein